MTQCVALLRGINVGRANRISMDDLRELFDSLGLKNVRTVLNSGNVIFTKPRPNKGKLVSAISGALASVFGVAAPVAVVTAADLAIIVRDNPLLHVVKDPARHLVAFATHGAGLDRVRALMKDSWTPDALAVSDLAAYLWCEKGVLESKLALALSRAAKNAVTTRNWSTVLKMHAACGLS